MSDELQPMAKMLPERKRAIAVIGPSGRGKSTSIEGLPIPGTIIFNIEGKKLPFKGESNFYQVKPIRIKDFYEKWEKSLIPGKVKIIVVDSFSAFTDMLLAESRIIKTGWDVWSYYNEMIYKYFQLVKKTTEAGIYFIQMAHDEILDQEGESVRRMLVKGKEWSGAVEKEFDIIVYAHAEFISAGVVEYKFQTQTNGHHPAKTPKGMFSKYEIKNSLKELLIEVENYDDQDSKWLI